eukprot:5890012-Prymnesium_polylepis.1
MVVGIAGPLHSGTRPEQVVRVQVGRDLTWEQFDTLSAALGGDGGIDKLAEKHARRRAVHEVSKADRKYDENKFSTQHCGARMRVRAACAAVQSGAPDLCRAPGGALAERSCSCHSGHQTSAVHPGLSLNLRAPAILRALSLLPQIGGARSLALRCYTGTLRPRVSEHRRPVTSFGRTSMEIKNDAGFHPEYTNPSDRKKLFFDQKVGMWSIGSGRASLCTLGACGNARTPDQIDKGTMTVKWFLDPEGKANRRFVVLEGFSIVRVDMKVEMSRRMALGLEYRLLWDYVR